MTDEKQGYKSFVKALAQAQLGMGHAKRDSENPYHKSRYADLAAVDRVCRRLLAENGFAVVQVVRSFSDQNGLHHYLDTKLMHEDGYVEKSSYPLNPQKPGPQPFGSEITYARRYSLAAIVGVVVEGEDDDAEGAYDRTPPRQAHKPLQSKSESSNKLINDAQVLMLQDLIASTQTDLAAFLAHFKAPDLQSFTEPQFKLAKTMLSKKLAQMPSGENDDQQTTNG